jgi:hypothetical protein
MRKTVTCITIFLYKYQHQNCEILRLKNSLGSGDIFVVIFVNAIIKYTQTFVSSFKLFYQENFKNADI